MSLPPEGRALPAAPITMSKPKSPLSRNRTFGERLGQGMTTEQIYASTRQVAEGAKSSSSLLALARDSGVDAPIAEAVDAVIAGHLTAPDLVTAMLSRDTKAETD